VSRRIVLELTEAEAQALSMAADEVLVGDRDDLHAVFGNDKISRAAYRASKKLSALIHADAADDPPPLNRKTVSSLASVAGLAEAECDDLERDMAREMYPGIDYLRVYCKRWWKRNPKRTRPAPMPAGGKDG
jgi:hypothetical protein